MNDKVQKLVISTDSWIRAVIVLIITYALFQVSHFVLVIITSVVIASSIEPATVWARKRGIPRLPAVLVVYVLAALAIAAIFYFLFLPLMFETVDFARTLPEYANTLSEESALGGIGPDGFFEGLASFFSAGDIANYLNGIVDSFSQGIFTSLSAVFGGMLSLVLIVVLSFYLAVEEDGIGKFLKVITPIKHEGYVIDLWRRSQQKIGYWLQGQLLLAVLVMILSYLGLLIIGVPHALLLAVMAGMFELIPLFGAILAAVPAMFVAFAADGTSTMLFVAGLYLVIQQFENHLLYPLVVKKVVGVPPMISILALILGAQLAGFLGVLISVPVAAAALEYFSDRERQKSAQMSEIESLES